MRVVRADAAGAREAEAALEAGGVVVLPTDTVYGLAARPADADAVRAVFRAKGRPEGMPLPILAADEAQVRGLGVAFTAAAAVLARRWWPGPLTLAFGFDAERTRPDWLAGRDEVAVRVPDHDFLRRLLARTGVLAVTSANPHGAPTPHTADEVAAGLGTSVDLVVDGGRLPDVPSTLVNVRGPHPVVEREGAIPSGAVAAALAEGR
ncbi:MAG TPA: L-threonylcarbamoyladenylate synthase [Acidimicrobiales bacterium]|nr:L-threonylcarbamoyladenylate synthase [Acidimicrobiales bacterium]